MGLLKRAHIRGMAHELKVQGLIAWPSKQAEEEMVDDIADSMSDEEMPEMTGDDGLTPEQVEQVLAELTQNSQAMQQQAGSDPNMNKEAASMDYVDAAHYAAISVMNKTAAEVEAGAGPGIPGSGPVTTGESPTAEAAVDAKNTPSSELVVPMGQTAFNSSGGEVGVQQTLPNQPGATGTPPTTDVAKMAAFAQMLNSFGLTEKRAADGASLSGGPVSGGTTAPVARKDVADNLDIPGAVATGMGKTVQNIPTGAQTGATTPNPAGPTGSQSAVDDAVKQAAETLMQTHGGRAVLAKLAHTYQTMRLSSQPEDEIRAAQLLQSFASVLTR